MFSRSPATEEQSEQCALLLCYEHCAAYSPELASLLGMVKRVYYQSRVQGPGNFHTADGHLFYTIPGIRTGHSKSIRSYQH
jgi:hypothetical protein